MLRTCALHTPTRAPVSGRRDIDEIVARAHIKARRIFAGRVGNSFMYEAVGSARDEHGRRDYDLSGIVSYAAAHDISLILRPR